MMGLAYLNINAVYQQDLFPKGNLIGLFFK